MNYDTNISAADRPAYERTMDRISRARANVKAASIALGIVLAASALSGCVPGPHEPVQRVDDHDTPASHGSLGDRPNAKTNVREFSVGGANFRSYDKGGLSYTEIR